MPSLILPSLVLSMQPPALRLSRSSTRWYAALDIETCPLPAEQFDATQFQRLEQQAAYFAEKDGLDAEAARSKAANLHPLLGWVCCVSVAIGEGPEVKRVKSWTAASPDEEAALLSEAWTCLGRLGSAAWITFNGKRFDAPFLRLRTLAHGLDVPDLGIFNLYPYSDRPHCDLMRVCERFVFGLSDLCALLGVESPKGECSGASVAEFVAAGDMDAVRRYCERDVVATYELHAHIIGFGC